MILLALAKTEKIRGHSSKNTQRTTIIIIRLLPPTTLLPGGETLFHLPLINILEIFKTFHQQPENIQKLFHLHDCLSRKTSTTRKNSKTFPPAVLS